MFGWRIGRTWALGILALVFACGPCCAWLFDGGEPLGAAAVINKDSTRAAEPLQFSEDVYATQFGAALGRAVGEDWMGFHVYLTDSLVDASDHTIATWKVSPTGSLAYYYFQPDSPLLLKKNKMYYLMFARNSDGFWGSIAYSVTQGSYYGMQSGDSGATWSMMARPLAVRIDGYYVPEPASFVSLAFGVAMLGAAAWRRRSRTALG